jgi:hypothetical protein
MGRNQRLFVGGPAVPSGRRGRAATRGIAIRNHFWLRFSVLEHRVCELALESAWRGFLSLRDPAGAKHAAGPPDITSTIDYQIHLCANYDNLAIRSDITSSPDPPCPPLLRGGNKAAPYQTMSSTSIGQTPVSL